MGSKQFEDIWAAIFNNEEKSFDELLLHVEIDEVDDSNLNLLQHAIAYERTNMAIKLIEKNINLNNQDYKGRTPLIYAVEHNNFEITKSLIEHGANLEISDPFGNTPLWYATFNVKGKYYDIVELLINAGASPSQINKSGKTAIDMAKTFNDNKLLTILMKQFAIKD